MSAPEPRIDTQTDGPYVVSGVPLRRRTPVETENGEPIAWRSEPLSTEHSESESYALCRCGASSNKPYCDGTHQSNGFDGSETAATDTYASRSRSYEGEGIVVDDDRALCVHAGFCSNKLSNVWKMTKKTDDTQVRSQVAAMVERCPSGALTYELGGDDIEPLLPAEVAVVPNGPLWVTGGVPVERADGENFETRNRVTLCRCGHSANKPLCDGSHTEAGFEG